MIPPKLLEAVLQAAAGAAPVLLQWALAKRLDADRLRVERVKFDDARWLKRHDMDSDAESAFWDRVFADALAGGMSMDDARTRADTAALERLARRQAFPRRDPAHAYSPAPHAYHSPAADSEQ